MQKRETFKQLAGEQCKVICSAWACKHTCITESFVGLCTHNSVYITKQSKKQKYLRMQYPIVLQPFCHLFLFKRIVHHKMQIMSSFTCPHVFPNPYSFFSGKQNEILGRMVILMQCLFSNPQVHQQDFSPLHGIDSVKHNDNFYIKTSKSCDHSKWATLFTDTGTLHLVWCFLSMNRDVPRSNL